MVQRLLHQLVVAQIPELEQDSTNLGRAVSFASQHLSRDNINVQKAELSSTELLSKLKAYVSMSIHPTPVRPHSLLKREFRIAEKLKINSWHASAQRLTRCANFLLPRRDGPFGEGREGDREAMGKVVNILLE